MWFQEPGQDLPTPIPIPVEEPVYTGPITDRSRMLGPPPAEPAMHSLPRFEAPPPPKSFEPFSASPDSPDSPDSMTAQFSNRRRERSRGMAGLVIVLASLALFLLVFLSLPNEIATYWPQTASLYNALGYEVNKSGFRIVATQTQELANSIPIIVIKGQIINETGRELDVPSVRLSIRDRAGRELHNWIVRADQDRLGPRGEGSFSARLESPPADAYDLEVRFTREGER